MLKTDLIVVASVAFGLAGAAGMALVIVLDRRAR